ncbi:MAG: DUF4386 domain-containing protein [Bacteroidota bacterium]
MKNEKITGWLLIAGAAGVFIPYTLLTMIFEYPDILRQETGIILTKFHEGGSRLVWTWLAFALAGIPLIPAYILIGQKLENKSGLVRTATTIGVIGLIVQMVGLLRWTFVVPVLADTYTHATDEATKSAAIIAFKTIHQFAGVILGEHLGQLFTIYGTVLLSATLAKLKLVPKWITWLVIPVHSFTCWHRPNCWLRLFRFPGLGFGRIYREYALAGMADHYWNQVRQTQKSS